MNKRQQIIKLSVAAALFLSMIAFVMPIVVFGDIRISVLDIIFRLSSEVTELADLFGMVSDLIQEEIRAYFVFCIFLVLFPVIHGILLFIIRNKLAFLVSLAGVLMNSVMGYIFYDKISDTVSLIREAVSFLDMDMDITMKAGTVIYWCIMYIFVLLLSVLGLLEGELSRIQPPHYQPISEILSEEIPSAVHMPQTAQEAVFELQPVKQSFYGGLRGCSGIYRDKIRPLQQGEALFIGSDSDSCDVWLLGEKEDKSYCRISYDETYKEYHVVPLYRTAVFLESGQPLGKDRTYCLPRGMTIFIKDKKHTFILV